MISIIIACLSLLAFSCKQKEQLRELQSESEQFATDTLVSIDSIADKTEGDYTLTDYDSPPVPLKNPIPVYPQAFRDSGIQGVVVLEVHISETGLVQEVKVLKSLLPGEGGLDETAISAVKSWTFKPSLKNKKPIPATVNIPIPFSLKK
jgi:protein TonB